TVELVGYVAPHAHTIAVSTYLGWISAFMHFSCDITAKIFVLKIAQTAPSDNQRSRLTIHGRQELRVALRLFDLVNQQFHTVNGIEGIKHLAQDPDAIELVIIQQELLFPGPGAVDINSREDPLVDQPAIEMYFHIT